MNSLKIKMGSLLGLCCSISNVKLKTVAQRITRSSTIIKSTAVHQLNISINLCD